MRMARIELQRGNRAEARQHVSEAITHHESVIARTNASANRRELGAALVTLGDVATGSESCAAFRRARQIFAELGGDRDHYGDRARRGAAACER
jgi:hypothetical protein